MQADELQGRGVLALSNAEKIGQVEEVLFDAQFRRVLGFRVKRGGLFGKAQALLRDSVTSIGAAPVTVPSPDVINDEALRRAGARIHVEPGGADQGGHRERHVAGDDRASGDRRRRA